MRNRPLAPFAVIAALFAAPAVAQTAMPCDWQAHADAIVEPWEENARSYANGNVRVALLDTIEPAAGAFYILILHPPRDDMGARTCTIVGSGNGIGYAGIFFAELQAGYNPAEGLIFEVPAIIYLPEQNFQNSTLLRITVNQSTGDVSVTQKLGRE